MDRPENVIVKKSERFADRIVRMCNYLVMSNYDYINEDG